MIWYDKKVDIKNQPPELSVSLLGYYEEPKYSQQKIGIAIVVKDAQQDEAYILHTEDPRGLAYEEPTSDEILAKYQQRLSKIELSIKSRDYKSLKIWLKSLSLFIRGRSSNL